MIIQLHERTATVTREPGDSPIRKSTGYAGSPIDPDSAFWLQVRNTLRKPPHNLDVIKKRMSSDGHMVDDLQQYVRTRNCRLMLWYGSWQINDAVTEYNRDGSITLQMQLERE